MLVMIIDMGLGILVLSLMLHNWFRFGANRMGKIGRALGGIGYDILCLTLPGLLIVALALDNKDLIRACYVTMIILILDEFLNGDDPPRKKRRAWLKNKFAKLAQVHS